MPQTIQRSPVGLLSLLDSKAGGIAPNQLSDEVRATFDIETLYGMNARRSAVHTYAAGDFTSVGTFPTPAGATVECPSGEIRHVRYLTAYMNGSAGANFAFGVGWWDDRNNTFFLHGVLSAIAGAGAASIAGGQADFWQIPGVRPAIFVTNRTTAEAIRLTVLYERATF